MLSVLLAGFPSVCEGSSLAPRYEWRLAWGRKPQIFSTTRRTNVQSFGLSLSAPTVETSLVVFFVHNVNVYTKELSNLSSCSDPSTVPRKRKEVNRYVEISRYGQEEGPDNTVKMRRTCALADGAFSCFHLRIA